MLLNIVSVMQLKSRLTLLSQLRHQRLVGAAPFACALGGAAPFCAGAGAAAAAVAAWLLEA